VDRHWSADGRREEEGSFGRGQRPDGEGGREAASGGSAGSVP